MFFGKLNLIRIINSPINFFVGFLFFLILSSAISRAQNFPNNRTLSSAILKLSEYAASPEFYKLRIERGELQAIDSLYAKAVLLNKSDTSEALLALTFALLPFREMNLKIPPFNSRLSLKLPTVGNDFFQKRTENLPRHFLYDSPDTFGSDTDKLSHFFGNAFISYNINFFKMSEFLGIFVESFEKLFKVGGAFDARDLETNALGKTFGELLSNGYKIFPSSIFIIYSARNLITP